MVRYGPEMSGDLTAKLLRQHDLGDQESVHVLHAFVAAALEPVRSKHFVSSLVQGWRGRWRDAWVQMLMSASCCGFCTVFVSLPSEIKQ